MLAAKDGFQAGQTAKARLGPPCAVTPERTWPPASVHRLCQHQPEGNILDRVGIRKPRAYLKARHQAGDGPARGDAAETGMSIHPRYPLSSSAFPQGRLATGGRKPTI
jgi:hypothetical protein